VGDLGLSDRPVWCNGKIPPMVYPRSLGQKKLKKKKAASHKLQAA